MDLIKETLTCKVCNNILKQPVFLPCHKTLCQTHIDPVEKYLKCFFCNELHDIPLEGFKPNEMARNLISSNTHLSEQERKYKTNLDESLEKLQKKYEEFMQIEPQLKTLNFEHFTHIRDTINEQRDKLKLEIDHMAEQMLKQTEFFEFKCKENLKQITKLDMLALNKERFRQIANELEDEFQRTTLNLKAIESLNEEIKQKTEQISEKLNEYGEIRERINESAFEKSYNAELYREFGYLSLIESDKLISCSSDKTIKIWKNIHTTNRSFKTLDGHTESVFCIYLLSNGIELVSGSFDKTLKIWNIESGECLKTFENTSYIYCINQLSNDLIVSGSEDGSIKVWHLADGECHTTIYAHASLVTSIEVLSHLQQTIVSASTDTTIKLWDLLTDTCVRVLNGHEDFVFCMKILRNGYYLASGSNDCTIKIWNLHSGTCLSTLDEHTDCVNNLQLLSFNKLVSCSDDFSIKIWDLRTNECVQTLLGHSNIVICVRVLSLNRLISGSRDNTIKMWDLNSGQCIQSLDEHEKSVNCILLASSSNAFKS